MTISVDQLPYRPCVGIMLMNKDGNIWVGERIDTPDAWQMPQGGVESGEELKEAALRELEEEIGVTAHNVSILTQTKEWLTYDLPVELVQEGKIWRGRYRGQKQHWFLCQLIGDEAQININTKHPEFGQWQWVKPAEIVQLIVPFKRDVYTQILKEFTGYL